MSSIMFVRVSTPEGTVSVTVEGMAEELARSNYEQAKGGKSMYDTLTSLRDAGIISASYVSDFMDAAVILARYIPSSKFMPSPRKRQRAEDVFEFEARRADLKERMDAHYEAKYAS